MNVNASLFILVLVLVYGDKNNTRHLNMQMTGVIFHWASRAWEGSHRNHRNHRGCGRRFHADTADCSRRYRRNRRGLNKNHKNPHVSMCRTYSPYKIRGWCFSLNASIQIKISTSHLVSFRAFTYFVSKNPDCYHNLKKHFLCHILYIIIYYSDNLTV